MTKILPILVTPENSISHSESVNFTTFLISVVYAVNYENINMSAKSSHMEDQRCNECKLENLWYFCLCLCVYVCVCVRVCACVRVLDDFWIVMSLKSSTGNKGLHHSKIFLNCWLLFTMHFVCTSMVANIQCTFIISIFYFMRNIKR